MGAESHSAASQPGLGKPPSTPEMSARDAEVMANAMLLDSPLPNLERANEEIPEDGCWRSLSIHFIPCLTLIMA